MLHQLIDLWSRQHPLYQVSMIVSGVVLALICWDVVRGLLSRDEPEGIQPETRIQLDDERLPPRTFIGGLRRRLRRRVELARRQ